MDLFCIDHGGCLSAEIRDRLTAGGYCLIAAGTLAEAQRFLNASDTSMVLVCPAPGDPPDLVREAAETVPPNRLIVVSDAAGEPIGPHRITPPLSANDLMTTLRQLVSPGLPSLPLTLRTFHEIGTALTSTLKLKEVLNVIAEKMAVLVTCEAWSLLLFDERTQELQFEIAVGAHGDKLKDVRLKLGQGIAGWVAEKGEPLIVPDARRDPRFYAEVDRFTGMETRSILCLPLRCKGEVLGVIELLNRVGEQGFTPSDVQLVSTLTDYAAIAIENARLFARAEDLAITDDVTQIHNMRYFSAILDRELNRAIRRGTSLSVVFADLDYFKSVNDVHGHQYGSLLLRQVAQLMKRSIRAVDLVARYGGDEFVVVLPDTDLPTAFRLAERLRVTLAGQTFLTDAGLQVKITGSFGVASFPGQARTKEELIRLADQAMYRAKGTRRNLVYSAAELLS